MERPNILYFVCHDLGRTLGCYGTEVATPNLDRLAKDGVKFNHTFCNSPACSPSRGCAMTGQYAHTNGLMGLVNGGWTIPEEKKTIVDYLNEAGYLTAHFGLQHERKPIEHNRYQIEGGGSIVTEHVVNAGIKFLEEHVNQSQPFYLNLGTIEVHESQWNSNRKPEFYNPGPDEEAYVPPFLPDEPPVRHEMANFNAAIRYLDTHLGRLFGAMDHLGYRENTLVVFTTDHGIAGMRSKCWLYDPGVSIALLMRMPGTIGQGVEYNHLIQNIDYTPTLLEAAGVDIPSELQGKSFWSLLTGGEYQPHDMIFIERNYHGGLDAGETTPPPPEQNSRYNPIRAVRTEQFHYIRHYRKDARRPWLPGEVALRNTFKLWYNGIWPPLTEPVDTEELYDILADPLETRNLANDPTYQKIKDEMAAKLHQWMVETTDPLLDGPIPDLINTWCESSA